VVSAVRGQYEHFMWTWDMGMVHRITQLWLKG